MKLIKPALMSIFCLFILSSPCLADFKPGKIHNFINTRLQKVCLEESQALQLDENGKVTSESVVALLDSPNSRVRAAAVYALGEIRDPSTMDILITQLGDSSRHMRRAAARALGKLREPEAIKPLVVLTQNQNEDALVRCTAIRALGVIGDQKALPCLQNIASNDERLLMANATVAMAKINGETYSGRTAAHKPVKQ